MAKIIIEVDGDSHGDEAAQVKDGVRDKALEKGYQVLRFWNWEVSEDLQGVMYKIERHLPPTPNPSPPGGGE